MEKRTAGSVTPAALNEGKQEKEQRCRQQMQRAGELCKRLLRRLDVAGASLRRALDGCRLGLERLEEDKRQGPERLRDEVCTAQQQQQQQQQVVQQQQVQAAPPRPKSKSLSLPTQHKTPPLGRQAKSLTPPLQHKTQSLGRQAKPPKKTQVQRVQAALQKQPSPPLAVKATSRIATRVANDAAARKTEKGKTSPLLLDLRAATKAQPKKRTWKPCKKA